MKRLIVSDTHLGMYSDADAWLNIVLNFYKHIIKYCFKNNITQLIHLGDFFDNRKSLNTKTQHTAHRIAKVLNLLSKDLHTYIIVGNHDCYYKNQIHPNTLELFKEYNHITVIDEITKLDDILLVPWGEVPESTQGAKYCFGHFAINGFHMNDSYRCKDGLDKVIFKDFDKILSGHFHTPSSNHNIIYIGAPYGQTFHDAGGVRGYHIFEDGKLTFIEYKDAPKFMKIYSGNDFGDDLKGNIVKLIFEKDYGTTKNQEIIDSLIEKKPFLYNINFTSIDSDETESDSESIEMESKEKIVDQFIDSQAFPVNIQIGILKSMFKKLMKETGESKTSIKAADGTKIECIEVGFQNFLSFGSKWQEVPLYNGVNFVTGFDKDKGKSNGAGKSSFLETIPFALFGKTARDIRQDQIVNWKNKKNCQVVFRFKINDDIYEINRQLKPNKLEIFKNGNLMDQDAHKSDYQSMFEDIFGMNVKMFMSLIHSNVNGSANIMNMKKVEKRMFLERMFGLEIYSDMNKLCNDKLREVENKKYKIDTDIDSADGKIESAVQLQLQFNKEIQSKNSILDDVNEIQDKVDKLKEDNPKLDSNIESLDKEINDKRESFHKITLEFETWKAKLDSEIEYLKKEIDKIERQEEQRKKNIEIKGKIEDIEKKSGKINKVKDDIENLKLQESETSKKYDNKFNEVSDIEKELVELRTNLKNIEKNLELLNKGICPVCGQDVTDPHTHYKKEQTSINKNISTKEKKLDSLKKKKEDFLTELSEIRKKLDTLDKTKDTLYRLENQLKEVGSEEKKDELIKDKENKINGRDKAFTLYNKKEKKHSNEMEALKNKYTDMCDEQSIIKVKEKELDLLKSQAKEAKKHIESLEGMIKKQDDVIELINSKKKEAELNKIKLNDITDYINAIKIILKDENIKQFTIKQIMPFMNKQTNYYLSEVNYGFYVKIDKWLDVEIKGPGIRNASYDSLSGGERRGIDIAIQLSLLDISRTQAGIFPDLLVFDELLDSSIDSSGINELMKIVKFKQKEFGGKIFIITHRPEIDGELIDYEYHIVKENGYSKVNI